MSERHKRFRTGWCIEKDKLFKAEKVLNQLMQQLTWPEMVVDLSVICTETAVAP